jgi:predicted lipoprotein with Yx(FWY)xxD motif
VSSDLIAGARNASTRNGLCCAQRISTLQERIMKNAMKASLAGLGLIATIAILGAAPASAEDYGPFKVGESSAGKVLVDGKGMTLYTFDKDSGGKSMCNGDCAKAWPPAMAMESDKPVGDLTIIKRDDGTMQWADGGKPLYTFVKDTKPGDVTGDKFKDVWHIVKEDE